MEYRTYPKALLLRGIRGIENTGAYFTFILAYTECVLPMNYKIKAKITPWSKYDRIRYFPYGSEWCRLFRLYLTACRSTCLRYVNSYTATSRT
ncbi:hypothetical protein DSM106972_087440 [Dulcicalothrix desertica PCC 7102]|uniref:Uncharacterized protein n=1 Tax=Dulcicalothrix desertica PCC 7102 TaxID=232991 RepID=A0A3S1BXP6_9CYAN|nr:hypothetical protein [Dulcicalothrix desertica]RUS96557.1 hypothetical protein DSM106972_087440 [Dulcicalothrix desertica PCC 7102]TWH51396.1 hypothetical protein CAL7102_05809 [Dulcicalothrix desertica PCC 7102]